MESIFHEEFLMGKQNAENKRAKKEMQLENTKKQGLMKQLSQIIE